MWWVGGAFAVLIGAWTTFFVIASNNRVQEVPLATRTAPSAPAK
jgi:hypothetical protein